MSDASDIRTALLGFGLAGSVFHGPLIAATAGMQLTTIVTADASRQQQARREHPGAAIIDRVSSFDALARDHDVVVVATPNRSHAPLARAALEAGLAVVIDKPMAPTSAQARELVELARRRGLLLTVFHNRRWDAEILTLRRLLDSGRLGTLVRVESRFERWRRDVSSRWRESADPQDAGGLLFDLGTHLIDQAVHLFGRPHHVYAEVGAWRLGAAVDDDDFMALHHDEVVVHLWTSLLAADSGPRLRARGSRGTYVVDGLDRQEEALRSGMRADDPEWGRQSPQTWGRFVDSDGATPVESERGAWPQFYVQLVAALRGEGSVPVAPEDGVAVLDIIETARLAARSMQVQPVRYTLSDDQI